MKRKLVVYLAGLLTVLSVGFGSAQFSDVPAGHWAREAVERIAQRGLITGFPDGTFRGNQNLTRYQAALIIDRLLQQLAQAPAAGAPAMSEEDLNAIRNAVQELAAEMAALGVRVSALEDNSATKDDVAALQAAIDELKGMSAGAEEPPADNSEAIQEQIDSLQQQIDELSTKMDEMSTMAPAEPAAPAEDTGAQDQIDSLQEQIDSLQQQIDELMSKAEMTPEAMPAEGGMDAAALSELSDRVEAASVAADTALAQAEQLSERLNAAESRVEAAEGNLAALQTQVEADADSIRALNELAVLLNQDVLSLQDRVTALEKTLADVDFDSFATKEDVSAIQEFATALRGDLVRLSDRVSALDTRVGGIDSRLTAVEGTRPSLTGSLNARYGYRTLNPGGTNFDADRFIPGLFADNNDGADFANENDSSAGGSLTFGLRRAATTTAGFNFTDARVTLQGGFSGSGNITRNGNVTISNFAINGNVDGQAVSIRYDNDNKFRFTPYFMNNSGDAAGSGFLVTANLSKALLSPSFTVALGTTAPAAATAANDDYFGIRGVVNVLGLNVGVNYAENDVRGGGGPRRALIGTDISGQLLGFLNLQAEVISSNNVATNTTNGMGYAQAGLGLGPISLRANYRSVDPAFANADWPANTDAAGLSRNDGDRIFSPANAGTGFGIIASANLGFITLDGYFDSSTPFGAASPSRSAFGVGANLPLFAGLSLTGYFNSANNGAGEVFGGTNPYSNQGPATRASFGSNLGVRLAHDGASPSALIGGLNLGFEFRAGRQATPATATRTELVGTASYALGLGFLTLTPNFRFHSFSTDAAGVSNYSTVKFGIQASTTAFNLGLFTLAANGAFANRSTDFATGTDASETIIRAGVVLGNFLLQGANLTASFGSGSGSGVGSYATRSDGDRSFDVDNDRLTNNPGGGFGSLTPAAAADAATISGFQIKYEYAGWGVWYNNFTYTQSGTTSTGTGLRIFYALSF